VKTTKYIDYWCKLLLAHREGYQRISRPICLVHTEGVHVPRLLVTRPHRLYVSLAVRREYSSPGHSGSTSTSPCIATTRYPAAQALRQPRRAPRVLVFLPQRLYIDYAVRRRDVIFWVYDYLDYLP
jgi:hypothetical protein